MVEEGNVHKENLFYPGISFLDEDVMISFGRACSSMPRSCGERGYWDPESGA